MSYISSFISIVRTFNTFHGAYARLKFPAQYTKMATEQGTAVVSVWAKYWRLPNEDSNPIKLSVTQVRALRMWLCRSLVNESGSSRKDTTLLLRVWNLNDFMHQIYFWFTKMCLLNYMKLCCTNLIFIKPFKKELHLNYF